MFADAFCFLAARRLKGGLVKAAYLSHHAVIVVIGVVIVIGIIDAI